MENIYGKKEGIIELKKSNFEISKNKKKIYLNENILDNLNGLIIVYAPWCSHCVLSKDMWINFSDLFRYKFNIFALNTYNYDDKNQDLVTLLDVHIYPSYITINKDGKLKKYNGRKNEDAFLKYILKNIENN